MEGSAGGTSRPVERPSASHEADDADKETGLSAGGGPDWVVGWWGVIVHMLVA